MKRIIIQGYPGAFHEIAARRFFKDTELEIVAADTFEEVVSKASTLNGCEYGIMAIENSISGSLLSNYKLLYNSNLQVIGEVFLRIEQNLLVNPGCKLDDLTEVYSHPIAFAQCRNFFDNNPHLKLIENIDTALSAKLIAEKKLTHAGAIASTLAAEMYGLENIAPSIETNKQNFTRFLILENNDDHSNTKRNKVSLCFSVSHEIGSLHKVLSILAFHNANLTKIQSVPLIGKPFEYLFFADFILDDTSSFDIVITSIRPFTGRLKILGNYQKGEYYGT